MVFSSISFLIYFLPLLMAVYFSVPARFRRARNFILLAASLVFYGWGGPKLVLLLVLSCAVYYFCGLMAGQTRFAWLKKAGLIGACVIGLGLLGWYKYAGFFAGIINSIGIHVPVPEVVLPIGISFFTFQGLSYVIDVYRGTVPVQKNPLCTALYVAMFPQVMSGPIIRYSVIADKITQRSENLESVTSGLVRFAFGLSKKMLLANAVGKIADAAFSKGAASLTASMAWLGAIAYTLQIYFDFSSYSDMAIGIARVFGFVFPENFNYPYIAKSITEFWRRWHISLSAWFRDYVYIPLGGNRCSKWKNIRNLAAVWLLTGLWHGSNWTFVLWGVWFLLLLMGEKFVWGKWMEKRPKIVRHVYTLLAVMFSWVLFRSDNIGGAVKYVGAMFGAGASGSFGETFYYLRMYWLQLIACVIASAPVKCAAEKWLAERRDSPVWSAVYQWAPKICALILLAVSYVKLVTGSFNPFI